MGRNSSRAWRRVVAYVIARDAGMCGICGHGGALTGDHIIPFRDWPRDFYGELLPGVDDPDNVRAAHGSRGWAPGQTEHNACYRCDPVRWPRGRLCNQSRGAGGLPPERHSRIW